MMPPPPEMILFEQAQTDRKPGEQWPRLSLQLTGPRDLFHCQSCDLEADPTDGIAVRGWQEHDDQDKPDLTVVLLCPLCSGTLIEKHPRLYRQLEPHEPWPGILPLCVGCGFQADVRCLHPDNAACGGPGMALTMPQPRVMFVDGRFGPKGGRRGGFQIKMYGPATACAGRTQT